MRQLLLLRHAKSSPAEPRQDDRDRPLSDAGRRAAAAMRAVMADLGLSPDLVLVSTSRRTMETLELLEPWPDTPLVEPLDELYLATPSAIRSVLNGVAETVRSVLLIGHNPGLHEFAVTLHDGGPAPADALRQLAEGFPTAALAEFAVPGPWWQLDAGRARLLRFVSPKRTRT
jgi:phosphohistidine phosphatase